MPVDIGQGPFGPPAGSADEQSTVGFNSAYGQYVRSLANLIAGKVQSEAVETAVDVGSELGKKIAALAGVFVDINARLTRLIREEVIEQQTLQAQLNLNELENERLIREEAGEAAKLAAEILLLLQGYRPVGVAMGLVLRDP